MNDITIPERLLVALYKHYYNPAVDYFRDKDGHKIWEELKDYDAYIWNLLKEPEESNG